LIVTLIDTIVAFAGIPVTASVCVAPAALPSGIGTDIVPDVTVGCITGGGGGVNCVFNCTGTPRQTEGEAGVITGVGGFGFTRIVVL